MSIRLKTPIATDLIEGYEVTLTEINWDRNYVVIHYSALRWEGERKITVERKSEHVSGKEFADAFRDLPTSVGECIGAHYKRVIYKYMTDKGFFKGDILS